MKKKVQTRSESTGIREFDTLEDAFAEAASDDTIWKVSWTDDDGKDHRMVWNDKASVWEDKPISDVIAAIKNGTWK